MIDPQDADIGRKVIYRAGHGDIEEGVLVAFNSVYVFVRYGSDAGSKATRREDCEWLGGPQ